MNTMNRIILLLFFACLLIAQGCFIKEECKETEAPEINFGLLIGGSILIVEEEGDNETDITNQYVDSDFNVMYYKVYCNGTNKGPFTTEFAVNEDGSLYKKSIGYYSFRMDNKEDFMRVAFFLDGKEVSTHSVFYDTIKPYDGSNAYLDFTLKLSWNGIIFTTKSFIVTIS